SLPSSFDLNQIGPNEKINIEVDRHLIELIFNSDDSIRGHEAKLERKTTKGKLSSSDPSVTSEVNSNALPANDPMEPASESQENEFSLLNLDSAV
ncbi:DNA-binding protein, partial [Klebsiella pneumoniae]